jgi:transmembrane sensor
MDAVEPRARNKTPDIPESALAEASIWVARLEGSDFSERVERRCMAWLADDPLHRLAFEYVAEVSRQSSDLLAKCSIPGPGVRPSPWQPLPSALWYGAVATTLVMVGLGLGDFHPLQPESTRIGEIRSVELTEGTAARLNTASQFSQQFDTKSRRVVLDAGEVMFEVGDQDPRPFIISSGGWKMSASGSTVVVRRDGLEDYAVWVKGRGYVFRGNEPPINVLSGQIVHFDGQHPPQPQATVVRDKMAWVWGRIELQKAPIARAVAEMNRYSPKRIRLPKVIDEKQFISCTFNVKDTKGFAELIARKLHLPLQEDERGFRIGDDPAAARLGVANTMGFSPRPVVYRGGSMGSVIWRGRREQKSPRFIAFDPSM